ncbi:MAG: transketolase [Pseudomonadota bacterium]
MPARRTSANILRVLAMDAVQQANSGHPGMPMGMADIAEVLWKRHLRHNPLNPHWANRDRFVLSNGHGSMLLYALLHLTGYELSLEDLRQFRQLHSKTPGHPEYGITPGVETSTGPLGQGITNAVGFALAQRLAAAQFNRPGFNLIDHHIYTFVGDGCLMEGISHEAASFAGTLGLDKLIVVWDDNKISIDGDLAAWFSESVPDRFRAYGWHVIADVDGHDADAIEAAIVEAKAVVGKPVFIGCRTQIGYGSPDHVGKASSHGSPLGVPAVARARETLQCALGAFELPDSVYADWSAKAQGATREAAWRELFEAYRAAYPELAAEFERRYAQQLPASINEAIWTQQIEQTQAAAPKLATRQASKAVLDVLGPIMPELLGGSADLTESNLTAWKGCEAIQNGSWTGNYLHYGVREFGMAGIMNGCQLYGFHRPYGGTFLVFSDYMRNAMRMAALMQIPVVYVLTHDSIGLGEDGPTHQPVEHLSMLRATPNLHVWRPCDAVETWAAWRSALVQTKTPSVLALSRQALPTLARTPETCALIARGGYVLWAPKAAPKAIIMATGSEVAVALEAAQKLEAEYPIQVVSMPSHECFMQQPAAYREAVLPNHIRQRIAIEAGASLSWGRFIGLDGCAIMLDRFGESAKGADVFAALGFDCNAVVAKIRAYIGER